MKFFGCRKMVPDDKVELDLSTYELLEFEVESFSEINGNERIQFISHKCYGRGKSLEDLTVPRMPFVCQNQKEDKHMMSASVSESRHSQRHTFKGRGRGRARLLQEQVKHMSSVPGHQSNSFKYIASNHIPTSLEGGYSMVVQNTDESYPTLTDSSCSQQLKVTSETCSEFSPLNISHISTNHDGKCDKEAGKAKKKKIKYRTLTSFITEACSETKPQLKYLERNNYADVNHKPDSGGRHSVLQPSLHETSFLDSDYCGSNHQLPTTFTHYVAKDLSKEEVSYDTSFDSLGLQNEENGEHVDEDVSCLDAMEKSMTCDGSDAKHVLENISVVYTTTSTMCEKSNECCAIDNSSQKLLTSAEGDTTIEDLEDVKHPSENNDKVAKNRPVVMNEENREHADEEGITEKRITCDGSDAKHVSEKISVAYTTTSTICEKINECCAIDNSSQKLLTSAEGDTTIEDLEDVKHPSENNDKVARNGPVVMNEENREHADEEGIMEKRISCDGSDAKNLSESISADYTTTSTMCEQIHECFMVDNSSQKLSTTAKREETIKDLEDVNHPSKNRNKGIINEPVTKKLYSSWKLEGSDVIQIDNVPKKCGKELETLVASFATILTSMKKAKKGTNSFRFKLNSKEACDWTVSCLHKAEIFPDTVLNCYLVEEELPNTEL
ncbi:uncharacterized protein LOC112569870 isoform X3 [Pomacea canaliculata]|uniref:uncharacterized protein LOC112569870 isoform X3 n=1 Tax=Pomacea canaliculata TaxID=400727 RepID=UPI000D736CB7|nr:uncharacterized protein LOC112569870 isoform X3 [Pomacea canaliculata]